MDVGGTSVITVILFFFLFLFFLWCLTPLPTIFQLYRGGHVYWWRKLRGPGENHRPVASHWQALSQNGVHLALIEIRTPNISGDRHWLHRHPVFALPPLCCVLSREATNTNFIVFGLTRSGLEPTIYRTRGEHTNHYTTDAVSLKLGIANYFNLII